MKKDCFYAFWSEDEINFCDGCDEDLQLYHGVILMKDGKPDAFCKMALSRMKLHIRILQKVIVISRYFL